jgi:hypothetical protein
LILKRFKKFEKFEKFERFKRVKRFLEVEAFEREKNLTPKT